MPPIGAERLCKEQMKSQPQQVFHDEAFIGHWLLVASFFFSTINPRTSDRLELADKLEIV